MQKPLGALCCAAFLSFQLPVFAEEAAVPTAAQAPAPDSSQMEKGLQQLPWDRFRQIVEAVPKLKKDVDAYGPLGWEYVKQNYASYPWKRNIDRLDPQQKQQLADLLRAAQQ